MFPCSYTKLVNIYRPTQPLHKRHVYASRGTPLTPHEWCYDPHHSVTPPSWHLLPGSHCSGTYQSPININTNNVVLCTGEKFDGGVRRRLSFFFFFYNQTHTCLYVIPLILFLVQMHIVSKKKDLTLDQALQAPDGLAVLGFFIEVKLGQVKLNSNGTHPTSALTSKTNAWKKLTSYRSKIHKVGTTVKVTDDISIDDLLGDVNRHEYYHYSGSLTTPLCSEAVVWTIFKESINVDLNLMKMFPNQTGYFNVYRPTQPRHTRTILTTAGSVRGRSGSVDSTPRHLLWFLLLVRSTGVYFI
uniref:Alpha-carbonic anhydrase domain-containing protein n=1 Tax=Pundamilia nyererei TaxID=303518 RepID=A0A3B4G9P7_9CICH